MLQPFAREGDTVRRISEPAAEVGSLQAKVQALQRSRCANAYEQTVVTDSLRDPPDRVLPDIVRVDQDHIETMLFDIGQERGQLLNVCGDPYIG